MPEVIATRAAGNIELVRRIYDGALFPDEQITAYRSIERLFPTRRVAAGERSSPVSQGEELGNFRFESRGKVYDLYDYVGLNRVSALLVLKGGKIRLESYQFGNDAATRWMSMSIAKSVTSTLTGVALREGLISGIDDPVIRYLPRLKGSAYDGVSLRQVLQMASGVSWNEDYLDPGSDRRRMLELQIEQKPGSILDFMATLRRAAPPGTRWNYSTGETHVLGALLEAAIGMPLSRYLSERIWAPAGMEADASWWLEAPDGTEVGGSGLSACLRDYGRFGLFLASGGCINGRSILPSGWLDAAGTPKTVGGQRVAYGYMLWPIEDAAGPPGQPVVARSFEARGNFGQHIYMNPLEEVVAVVWSALPKPSQMATIVDHDFFAALVQALRS